MTSLDLVRAFIRERPRQAKNIIATLFNDDEITKNDLLHDWAIWKRPEQSFALSDNVSALLLLCGRGWGKTHWLSNDIIDYALSEPNLRVGLMAADYGNLKKVNFLGDSGIINSINPNIDYEFNKSDLAVEFPNGSQIISYSAEAYDKTRGQQFHRMYLDELAAWQYDYDALDACRMLLRLGENPIMCIATTPRPTQVIRDLANDPKTQVIRGITADNYFLPEKYVEELKRKLTDRLFRQECLAEILDDNPYALFKRTDIDGNRVSSNPHLKRIIVAIDPAVTSNEDSDETGIVVAGIGADNHFYILEDCTCTSATPEEWAERAVKAYNDWKADNIVAEVNNGGDMIETMLKIKQPNIPVKKVRATRGKQLRAEPIAAIYERNDVHHVGRFDLLERQMTEWDPVNSDKSPDRLDALVWALTELSEPQKLAMIF